MTFSIGWSCGECSLGWGYCTERLDLQAPTVAAKAPGRTLHAENFSELIWKFEPVRIVRICQDYPFWFCDMGLVPTLGCTLGCTLFHFATETSPQERFRTVQNGSELLWGCLRMVFGHVWTSFWEFFVCFIVVLHDFRGFNPPGKDLKRKDSTTQKKRLWNRSWWLSLSKALCLLAYFNARELDKFDIEAAKLPAPCQTPPLFTLL